MRTVQLTPTNKGFRSVAGSGNSLTEEDVIWEAQSCQIDFTTLTALGSYGGSAAGSTHQAANAGAGERAAASAVPVAPSYDHFGLYDAAGTLYPGIYSSWYGFHTSTSGISGFRVGSADVNQSIGLVLNSDVLRVTVTATSVLYLVNDTLVYEASEVPAAAQLMAGVVLYNPGAQWRDGKLSGLTLSSRY